MTAPLSAEREKTCTICGAAKPLDEFRRDSNRPDGRRSHCKSCASKMDYEYRKTTNPEKRKAWGANYRSKNHGTVAESRRRFRKDNPDKARAWNTLDKAVRRGRVVPQPCEACGSKNAEAHHPDYQEKLDVRWLCHKHHCLLHRAEKAEAELAKQAPLVNALLRIANEAFPLEVTEKCMRSVARAALALREGAKK